MLDGGKALFFGGGWKETGTGAPGLLNEQKRRMGRMIGLGERSAVGTPGPKAATGRLTPIPPSTRTPTLSPSSLSYHPIGIGYPRSPHGHLRPHSQHIVCAMSFIIIIIDTYS